MIKINLIPTKRKKKTKPIPAFIVLTIVLLGVSVAGVMYGIAHFSSRVSELENKDRNNLAEIAKLDAQIKEVADFEKRNKSFTDQKRIIEDLSENQSLPVRILDELSMRMTKGIWFESLEISSGKISIKGVGFTNPDIVTFIQSLKGSPMFADVVLTETINAKVSEVDVYKFGTTFTIAQKKEEPKEKGKDGGAKPKKS